MKESKPQKPKNVFLRDIPKPVEEVLGFLLVAFVVFAGIGLFGLVVYSLLP